jgi:hypothetical protein
MVACLGTIIPIIGWPYRPVLALAGPVLLLAVQVLGPHPERC